MVYLGMQFSVRTGKIVECCRILFLYVKVLAFRDFYLTLFEDELRLLPTRPDRLSLASTLADIIDKVFTFFQIDTHIQS